MNISRLRALILKEFKQMTRDPSSFLIGIIIPLMLIFLIGHGLSMDVKNISVAVVLEDTSPTARDTVSFLDGSPYFIPRYETSMQDAEKLMSKRKADVILCIPPLPRPGPRAGHPVRRGHDNCQCRRCLYTTGAARLGNGPCRRFYPFRSVRQRTDYGSYAPMV